MRQSLCHSCRPSAGSVRTCPAARLALDSSSLAGLWPAAAKRCGRCMLTCALACPPEITDPSTAAAPFVEDASPDEWNQTVVDAMNKLNVRRTALES